MTSQVALVEIDKDAKQAFKQALNLIGGIDDLNTKDHSVVIKVGVFDPKAAHHTTVDVTNAIIDGFDKAKTIYLTESDNYRGTGTKRLQIWKQLFSKHVIPFNLSEDTNTKQVKIAGENMGLSHILFKPNILVSTHILRTYDKGSVMKNLFGLTSDKKRAKYHKKLESTILDIYEAVSGIDLAVLDGTYANLSVTPDSSRIESNVLVIGRDAVAVEAVGFAILGISPLKIPLIQEAVKRGLGEGDMSKIEVLGCSVETVKEKIASLLKEARAGKIVRKRK